MTHTVGIIGEPGVGKTTVMREVIRGIKLQPGRLGAARWMQSDSEQLIVMGDYSGHMHDGTDRLSMSCYADLEAASNYFSQHMPLYSVIWEGDRMTRGRWLKAILACGYALTLYHVTATLEAAQGRRKGRGSNQNASWIAGRRTTSARMAASYDAISYDLTSETASVELAELIRRMLHCSND